MGRRFHFCNWIYSVISDKKNPAVLLMPLDEEIAYRVVSSHSGRTGRWAGEKAETLLESLNSFQKAHKLWNKAKRNVPKTRNVHQPQTHQRLCVNPQYEVLLHLPPFSRYLMTT